MGDRASNPFISSTDQLFQAEVAPVPPQNQNQHLLSPVASVGYSSPSSSAPPAGGPSSSGHGGQKPLNTLDEPVWDTILRDLKRIGANVVLVVFPFTNRDQQSAALRNWDLWGPMAFTLTLAICLSIGQDDPGAVFSVCPSLPDLAVRGHVKGYVHAQDRAAEYASGLLLGAVITVAVNQVVFGVCAVGAVVLTLNVVLLGGNIGFFQSLCLLGYCLLPLDVAAIVATFVTNHIVRSIVVAVALAWASWASVPFIGGSVSPARKVLAVYPLLLLFFSMGWLALVKN